AQGRAHQHAARWAAEPRRPPVRARPRLADDGGPRRESGRLADNAPMKERMTTPWMSAADYGRTLAGLSVNLIVREVARSVPFYADVLGLRLLHSDADFAAFEGDGV